MEGPPSQAVSYVEWLRKSKGQPTFRSMLESDLRAAIESANDLGHFFLLMEHMGYEIYHGNRLGFCLHGQDRFMYPGRKNPLFTENGIQTAIEGNLATIETGLRPAAVRRPAYRAYHQHPKYTGLLALYVHYLYVLGKVVHRRYPPRMTPQLRREVMKAERYRAQFSFLRDNDIATQQDMAVFETRTEETLTKQRTILNVRKKKRRKLYQQFQKHAKKQKILFSAIKDKDDKGRLIDVVVPVTELDRTDLIFERIMYQGPARYQNQISNWSKPGPSISMPFTVTLPDSLMVKVASVSDTFKSLYSKVV